MELPLYQIDSFTNTLFKGNPAAVVLLTQWLPVTIMQAIAAENNLSETAFIKPITADQFAIRYFTPVCEVPLCGHATLASALVVFKEYSQLSQVTFITLEQTSLVVTKKGNSLFEMSFPKQTPTPVATPIPIALHDSLSIKPQSILKNNQAYFAIYAYEQDIYDLTIDYELVKQLAPQSLVVTAASKKYDFISRYFAPTHGINEDPVTGSIHTGLVPYWAQQLSKKQLHCYQASARGGVLYCQDQEHNILIAGHAVLYAEATIELN